MLTTIPLALLLLVGAAPPERHNTSTIFRGAPSFALGVRGTTLALVEHADGSLVLRVGDQVGSTTCALPDKAAVASLRDLFVEIESTWFLAPNSSLPALVPLAAHIELPVCELTAYTRDHRVYLQAVRMDAGMRTDLVTAELSPIRASHTVVDRQSVQRAEDNADALKLVQVAAALAAGASSLPGAQAGRSTDTAVWRAALYGVDAAVSGSEIEDTSTRYLRVIDAHTDLALSVIVLDAFLYGGHLPRSEDIEGAYRIRDLMKESSPPFFCRTLTQLAAGKTASELLIALRGCTEEGTPAAACLRE